MKDFLSKITLGAASKKAKDYVDTALGTKLDKYNGDIPYSVYAKVPSGDINIRFSKGVAAETIMQRDENGCSQVADPVYGSDIATKDYVDSHSGGGDVIVEAAENKTVNGYLVPKLTDEELVTIYNAVVAGDSVVIVDATETMFFTDVNADSVNGDLFISFRYFTSMILEYGEGDVTNYTEIGGGGLQMDLLWENANPNNDFVHQAVNLLAPVTDYDFIVVIYNHYNYRYNAVIKVQPIEPSGTSKTDTTAMVADNSIVARPCTISRDPNDYKTVYFGYGYRLQYDPLIFISSTARPTPWKIYGIK